MKVTVSTLSAALSASILFASVAPAPAQDAVEPPKPPQRTSPRGLDIGPGNIGGGLVQPPPRDQTIVRTASYIALGPDREWTSTDGQVITAKVIAWQDSVEESVTEGKPTPEQRNPSAPPAEIAPDFVPIVLQDNQVRIMRGKQVFALALDRLSEPDQAYVRQLDEAVRATAARREAAEKAAGEQQQP